MRTFQDWQLIVVGVAIGLTLACSILLPILL